ncbi:MAG: hypothetical protein ACI4EO_09095 [Blautia sp.]
MKRKLLVAFLIFFSVFLSVCLFTSMMCGAPSDNGELGRYLFGAVGMALFLPAGFSFFLFQTLKLNQELENLESAEAAKTGSHTESESMRDYHMDSQLPALVNALAEKRNLTEKEKEDLLAYLEEL